jgi:hypothetical protein
MYTSTKRSPTRSRTANRSFLYGEMKLTSVIIPLSAYSFETSPIYLTDPANVLLSIGRGEPQIRVQPVSNVVAVEHLRDLPSLEQFGQRGCVLWFTGVSGSGKSTVAYTLEHELFKRGKIAQVLDGDNIRHGLNSNLGFTAADREENIRRIGEVDR